MGLLRQTQQEETKKYGLLARANSSSTASPLGNPVITQPEKVAYPNPYQQTGQEAPLIRPNPVTSAVSTQAIPNAATLTTGKALSNIGTGLDYVSGEIARAPTRIVAAAAGLPQPKPTTFTEQTTQLIGKGTLNKLSPELTSTLGLVGAAVADPLNLVGPGEGKAAAKLLSRFHPDDLKYITRATEMINEGKLLGAKEWQRYQEIFAHYGMETPKTQTKAADFFNTVMESNFSKTLDAQVRQPATVNPSKLTVKPPQPRQPNGWWASFKNAISSEKGAVRNPFYRGSELPEEAIPPRATRESASLPNGSIERGYVTSVKQLAPEIARDVAGEYLPRSTDNLAVAAKNEIAANPTLAERLARTGTDDKAVAIASEYIKKLNQAFLASTDEAIKNTLAEQAGRIANDAARNLTEAGRTVQAASILGKLTPEGQVRFAAREIQKYNAGRSAANQIPELTAEQSKEILERANKVFNMADGEEKAIEYQKLQDYISSLVPTPFYKKLVAVWKAGLLTGLKTSGLNIASNLSHAITEGVKDIPAVAVDSIAALFTGKRTTALTGKGTVGGTVEGVKRGWRYLKTGYDVRDVGGKLDLKKVNFGKSRFAKAIQAYEETVFKIIGSQDQPFYYGAKARSLASQAIAIAKNEARAARRGANGPGAYLYHGTNEEMLDSIAKQGLKPMGRGLLSLSKDEAYARSFAESSLFPRKEGQGVMFRVKSNVLDGKTVSPDKPRPASDELHEILTKVTIPPKDVEVLKDGKWQPLVSSPAPQSIKQRVEELIQNPTDEMLRYATIDAEMAVFQNMTALGNAAKTIQRIPLVGEVIAPFTRTPAAVMMQMLNYSPAGLAKPVARILQGIKNGTFDQRLFSQEIGRALTGTTIGIVGMELYKHDLLSLGYPKTEKEQKQWQLEGRTPNSIKINGTWRSANVLGPAGLNLIVAGYVQQALETTGSVWAALTQAAAGVGKTMTDQTVLKGAQGLIEAISDPVQSGERYFAGLLGSLVPTIVGDVAHSTDTTERRTEGITGKLQSRIPGLRERLEPQVDVFGREVSTPDFLTAMADPTRPGTDRSDPAVRELRRLWDAGHKTTPTQLGDKQGFDALTPEQNTDLWETAGKAIHAKMLKLVEHPKYKKMDDEEKAKTISGLVDHVNTQARAAAVADLTDGLSGDALKAELTRLKQSGLLTKAVFEAYKVLRAQNPQ